MTEVERRYTSENDTVGERITKPEQVNHPQHYGGDTTYEAIKVIEAWRLDFCLGNAAKYICRAGKKHKDKELEDCEKALWYVQRRIDQLKGRKGNDDKCTG